MRKTLVVKDGRRSTQIIGRWRKDQLFVPTGYVDEQSTVWFRCGMFRV